MGALILAAPFLVLAALVLGARGPRGTWRLLQRGLDASLRVLSGPPEDRGQQ